MNYLKLTVCLECLESSYLPSYLGSTLRGALGKELKRINCTEGLKTNCPECINSSTCCYPYIFNNIHDCPNPFVIEPPIDSKRSYREGEALQFNLLLIGGCIRYLPYFIYAIERMALGGLGIERKRFELKEITDVHTGHILYQTGTFYANHVKPITWQYTLPEQEYGELRMRFITPFRFKWKGKIDDSLNFEILMRNLFRRASMMSADYCNHIWDIDYKAYLEMARHIAVKKADFRWHDWQRYSNRNKAKIKMGGIVGECIFKGKVTSFVPYIELGSLIHIGKGCTMGLGKYIWGAE